MTTSLTHTPAPPRSPGATLLRPLLAVLTVVACLPYLALKAAWIAGSRIGIPSDSPLLHHGTSLVAINTLTVAMDSTVVALALALVRPWGKRIPAWLMAPPLWCASGLLGPIVVAFPAQTLYAALFGAPTAGGGGHGPGQGELLEGWVFAVVYTGFICQAATLGTLFVLYARERWGALLRGPVTALPGGRPVRRLSVAAALTAVPSGAVHLLWALGADTGLDAARVAERNAATHITESAFVLFPTLAVAGLLTLAYGRGGKLPLRLPFALTWLGSGTLACWGPGCCSAPP